ncbi:N-acetylmuramoyl-L-alanine amidase, partial [Romboutsia sp.]|uniref:N-acetylmuramoyl-L-alanine amidase n=1 Tax=Romboutsia sp. TaxID=1965302 RepID=UPI002BD8BC58
MIREINKKIIINMLIISLFLMLPILSKTAISYADNSIENEFVSIINKYDKKDIVIENGISLRMGESLDCSKYVGYSLSNNTTVQMNENHIIKPINPGTVFLTYKIGDKVHIIEIYVPEEKVNLNTTLQRSNVIAEYSQVSRNYYKVFIDPGHGGSDSGALGFGNAEKDLNLQVATKVRNKLESKGIEVRMSRTSDVYLALSERARLANDYGADVFVSIHQNSADNVTANGIETFYHTDKTTHKPYAESIQNNLIKETGATNRGVKTANFAVLRETSMTSALAECGFISNQQESAKLSDPYYQDKLATAIANGIENYLKNTIGTLGFSDIQNHWAKVSIEDFASKGYIGGYEDGTFRPDNPITRAEFVKIVNKVCGFTQIGSENFNDVNTSNWFYNDVCIGIKAGYIKGYEDNT